jgi:hypothetical protein
VPRHRVQRLVRDVGCADPAVPLALVDGSVTGMRP